MKLSFQHFLEMETLRREVERLGTFRVPVSQLPEIDRAISILRGIKKPEGRKTSRVGSGREHEAKKEDGV
jgi:hypothetical protein